MAFALLTLGSSAASAEPAVRPGDVCAAPAYHGFDFFTGDFVLLDEKGAVTADETVSAELHDCILHEYLMGKNGRIAQSVSFFDPVSGHWRQEAWGLGLIFRLEGGLTPSGAMRLDGFVTHVGKAEVDPMRLIFTPQPDGSVKEELLEARAGSTDLKPVFTGTLKRK